MELKNVTIFSDLNTKNMKAAFIDFMYIYVYVESHQVKNIPGEETEMGFGL